MNKKIEMLKNELTKHNAETANVQEAIQKEYNKIFDKDAVLEALMERATECAAPNKADQSGYMFSEDGGIDYWCRFQAIDDYREVADYLNEWVSTVHGLYIDWKNDAVISSQGGGLVVGVNGDVYDTDAQDVIVKSSEYSNDAERNTLIEKHMERTGYFPGVFRESFGGELFPIDTTGER